MTRAENVAEAQRLRAAGLSIREIAAQMGALPQTVGAWLCDPDLSKQRSRRRSRYGQPCIGCGKPTDGSGGRAVLHERCADCDAVHRHEMRYWTPARVVAALRSWADELGRAPTATEAAGCGVPIGNSIVVREFGSWSAGIAAAGLPPRTRGQRDVSGYCYSKPVAP